MVLDSLYIIMVDSTSNRPQVIWVRMEPYALIVLTPVNDHFQCTGYGSGVTRPEMVLTTTSTHEMCTSLSCLKENQYMSSVLVGFSLILHYLSNVPRP